MLCISRELFEVPAQMAGTSEWDISIVLSFRSTLQEILGSLFARAVAALFLYNRLGASFSQVPKLYFSQLCGRIRIIFGIGKLTGTWRVQVLK
jgi:hypothetical protein